MKDVKSEKIKGKSWFCDKDLSSADLLCNSHDFIKNDKFV